MLNKQQNTYNLIITIVIAVLINLKIVSQSLVQYLHANDGFFSVVIIAFYFVFLLVQLWRLIRARLIVGRMNFNCISIYIFIIIGWYCISSEHTETSIVQLISYVLIPPIIMVCVSEMNIQKLLEFVMIISAIALPVINNLLVVDYRNSLGMDVAYAFLPGIIAAIVHLVYYRKTSSKLYWILYFIENFYLLNILRYSVRGPIVCIISAVLFVIYLGPNRKTITLTKAILGLGIFITVFFADSIISLLINNGVDWYFLRKTQSLLETGNILHGRDNLVSIALQGFFVSPFIGNGLNSFHHYTGYIYPHNLIAQLLFEGGVFITLLFLVMLGVAVYKIFSNKDREEMLTFIFLTPSCFIYFLMSANIWNSPLLWLLKP